MATLSFVSKPLKVSATVVRYLLGAIFLVFGLNGFLGFIPQPELSGTAATYMGGLAASGFFFPLVKGLEVLAGALLLSNRFVPLAIAILGPITLNIFLFHSVLTPPNPISIFVFAANIFLAIAYKGSFKSVFAK